MPYIIVIILLLVTVVPDLYIAHFFLRGEILTLRLLYWLPLVAIYMALVLALCGYQQEWMLRIFIALILCTALPKLFFLLFSATGKGISYLFPPAGAVGNVIGMMVGIVVIGIAVYGFTIGWKRVTVREVEINFPDLPVAFDGYKIVQLSDLHIGTYRYSPETLHRIVRQVNELNPDAVFFTGDIVNSSPDELEMFIKPLSEIAAKDGIYSILGNHDYCTYNRYNNPQEQAENLQKVIQQERMMGWNLLLNEHRIIRRDSDSIAIVGVENDGKPPFPALGDLPKATSGIPEGLYKVLLSHDPTHWRRKVLPQTDIQLTLSGHTHAMQLRFGNFSPSSWAYPEWGGLYYEGKRVLHVSTGTGSNVPFRWGAWPEIDVITLHTVLEE